MNELQFNADFQYLGYMVDDNGWENVNVNIEGLGMYKLNDYSTDETYHRDVKNIQEYGLKPELMRPMLFRISEIAVLESAFKGVSPVLPYSFDIQTKTLKTAWESKRMGSMDYYYSTELLKKGCFFLIGNKVYNAQDAGNYLWGVGISMLKYNSTFARFGAHVNEFSSNLHFDTRGDQQAIQDGIDSYINYIGR